MYYEGFAAISEHLFIFTNTKWSTNLGQCSLIPILIPSTSNILGKKTIDLHTKFSTAARFKASIIRWASSSCELAHGTTLIL